jgi:hypothetical protein
VIGHGDEVFGVPDVHQPSLAATQFTETTPVDEVRNQIEGLRPPRFTSPQPHYRSMVYYV